MSRLPRRADRADWAHTGRKIVIAEIAAFRRNRAVCAAVLCPKSLTLCQRLRLDLKAPWGGLFPQPTAPGGQEELMYLFYWRGFVRGTAHTSATFFNAQTSSPKRTVSNVMPITKIHIVGASGSPLWASHLSICFALSSASNSSRTSLSPSSVTRQSSLR